MQRRPAWRSLWPGVVVAGALVSAAPAAPLPPGWHPQQVFADYSPLAAKREFVARVFPPTVVDRLWRFEREQGVQAVEHTVDLARERFDLFVPERPPPRGYGLLVFVSPMPEAFPLAPDWKRELQRRGIVYVSAHRSGNRQNAFERRLPLALHAYQHVLANYPLDPERVMVGGFSGGSRMAQRLALAYPDVFRAALLIGGSDAFGAEEAAPPPGAERMALFRGRTRVVFATGGEDLPNRGKDERTRASFAEACVANVHTVWVPRIGHWVPDRRGLAKALDAAEAAPAAADAACVANYRQAVDAELAGVEALLAAGDAAAAGRALGRLEDRVGGLAAPRSLGLARRIAAALAPTAGAADD